jgi:hypothetical protein
MDEGAIFHPLDFSILNSSIPLTYCDSKLLHQHFMLKMIRDLKQKGRTMPQHQTTLSGRLTPSTSQPIQTDMTQQALAMEWKDNSMSCVFHKSITNKTKLQKSATQFGLC